MKINLIAEITILCTRFDIIYDIEHNGGNFDILDGTIIIGTKDIHKDSLFTLSVISHELFEIIYTLNGGRYQNQRDNSYLFNFDHITFENSIQIHTEAIVKFIGI